MSSPISSAFSRTPLIERATGNFLSVNQQVTNGLRDDHLRAVGVLFLRLVGEEL
jgi:hypothetical protein